ncbi:MAG: ArsS family sensor histidine kinase [Sulfuricurvum sp.]|uniref:ArsS family sensor histidine kinase n=1 Tax=Sulfuricurvum sp. TaxID=2025608 RepID=UPI00261BA810|nr:ArsS family sensor histidine kinase [Sulfuricurvum sp.]MDD2828792.1 ArsS family sensor histidine kinase [Sulfuricurvum sp.]MDD4948749.1 ArsS family sensor histidine kinase [Sulfuricurvum sp.]
MAHSIFLRITLFFMVTLTAMIIGFYSIHQKIHQEHTHKLEIEAGELLLILRQSIFLPSAQRHNFLQEHGYSSVQPHPDLIKTLHTVFNSPPKSYPPEIQDSIKEGKIQILKDENHLYVYLTKATPPLLVIKTDAAQRSLWPEMIFISLIVALLLLYWLIIKTLFPLKRLIHSIHNYANEGTYIPIKSTQKDEIALVAQALDNAMHKNQTLLEARRLFLRNIMHELKTPITVGKLSLPFLKKGEEKSILERAFFRMENLIAELVRVEQITSGALVPHLEWCEPEQLSEKAISFLFLTKESIESSYDGTLFYVDCDVFVTVFKNLIDNGIKYSNDGKVRIIQKNESLYFYNKGEPWPAECTLETLSEPFFHHHQNPHSFGLGLYIVKSIIDAHNFTLSYSYTDGEHCFEIFCHNPLAKSPLS